MILIGGCMSNIAAYSGKISDILVRNHLIDAKDLVKATDDAKSSGVAIEKFLVQSSIVPAENMTLAISEYLDMAPICLSHFTPDSTLVELIPRDLLKRNMAIPVAKTLKNLTLALGDPFNIVAVDEIQAYTGMSITPLVTSEKDIVDTLERCYAETDDNIDMQAILEQADTDFEIGHESEEDPESKESIEAMLQSAEGAPVIRMVNMMLLEALRTGASDIHVEPQERVFRLRYRIDGALIESPSPPKALQGAIISRMKLMSGMDIAERRIPQDGRIKIRALGKEIDLRVNTLPSVFGEKIVLRILDKTALFPNLAALGLDEEAYRTMRHGIVSPNGIILVTGPTGSGKTTTLYSCLQELNEPSVNIVTCEDPVEYQLPGINQVQINSYVGLNFSTALRSVLRQSPDIILVGEIRDSETGEIAIKAALTGHLVLSTLHTNDAAGAITRMIDMGVEPSLLASSLILAQAQRLIRKLCPACRMEGKIDPETLANYRIDPDFFKDAHVYDSRGCPKCHNTGFKGRAAIMEVLPVDRELRSNILQGLSAKEIAATAIRKGMLTLKDIGLIKVRDGITSLDAALQVTGGD